MRFILAAVLVMICLTSRAQEIFLGDSRKFTSEVQKDAKSILIETAYNATARKHIDTYRTGRFMEVDYYFDSKEICDKVVVMVPVGWVQEVHKTLEKNYVNFHDTKWASVDGKYFAVITFDEKILYVTYTKAK